MLAFHSAFATNDGLPFPMRHGPARLAVGAVPSAPQTMQGVATAYYAGTMPPGCHLGDLLLAALMRAMITSAVLDPREGAPMWLREAAGLMPMGLDEADKLERLWRLLAEGARPTAERPRLEECVWHIGRALQGAPRPHAAPYDMNEVINAATITGFYPVPSSEVAGGGMMSGVAARLMNEEGWYLADVNGRTPHAKPTAAVAVEPAPAREVYASIKSSDLDNPIARLEGGKYGEGARDAGIIRVEVSKQPSDTIATVDAMLIRTGEARDPEDPSRPNDPQKVRGIRDCIDEVMADELQRECNIMSSLHHELAASVRARAHAKVLYPVRNVRANNAFKEVHSEVVYEDASVEEGNRKLWIPIARILPGRWDGVSGDTDALRVIKGDSGYTAEVPFAYMPQLDRALSLAGWRQVAGGDVRVAPPRMQNGNSTLVLYRPTPAPQ